MALFSPALLWTHPAPSWQWDVSYWAERLKEAKYALEEEQLRPYFALPNVLEVRAVPCQVAHVPWACCAELVLRAEGLAARVFEKLQLGQQCCPPRQLRHSPPPHPLLALVITPHAIPAGPLWPGQAAV